MTLERILELISPFPRQAEAAPWREVYPLLQRLRRATALIPGVSRAKEPSEEALAALELLTERYPVVKKSELKYTSRPIWEYPRVVFADLLPGRPGTPTIEEYVRGSMAREDLPYVIMTHPLRRTELEYGPYGLLQAYAHESAHMPSAICHWGLLLMPEL